MDDDQEIIRVAKELASALRQSAYTRKPEDKQQVALLHTELCRLCPEEGDKKDA
jgi:hypothetical protein